MFRRQDKEPIKANLNLPQAAQPGGVDGRQVLLAQGEDDPGPQDRSLTNLEEFCESGRGK